MLPEETSASDLRSTQTTAPPRADNVAPVLRRFGSLGLMFAALGIAIFFSFHPTTQASFPSFANLQVVAANQAVLAILALAALIPLICGEFDLSVGATLGVTSIFSASVMAAGWPVGLALACSVALGGFIGLVNGLLVTLGRVNSVIATLGTSTIMGGLAIWRTGGETLVAGIPDWLTTFGSGATLSLPNTVISLVPIVLVVWYLVDHTPLGRYWHAIGSNREASRLVGLRVNGTLTLSFIAAGALSGVAGSLLLARSGSANPHIGQELTLAALAAAFLSAAAIKLGRFNVWGVIVAIAFLAVLNSGLNLAGVQVYINDLVNGTALILGVSLASFLGKTKT